MVIPGMESVFVSGINGLTDDIGMVFADSRTGPGCSHEDDLRTVETGGIRPEHLPEESGLEQPPQMPAHVIGTDGKIKSPANTMICENFTETGHSAGSAAKSVHIDTESYRFFHLVNSPDLIASFRKKSSVVSMDCSKVIAGSQLMKRLAFLMLGLRCWTS